MNTFTALMKRCFPLMLIVLTLALLDATLTADSADARSRSGGKSFSMPSSKPSPQQAPSQFNQRQQELLDRHFLRKHGKAAYYGQAGASPR